MVVNRMKTNEFKALIKGLSTAELLEREAELKKELFNLRFQLATGQLEDTARLRTVRKSIARIKTALREQNCLNKPAKEANINDDRTQPT